MDWFKNLENIDGKGRGVAREYYGSLSYDGHVANRWWWGW